MTKLSPHFSFEELTTTAKAADLNGDGVATVAEFVDQNRSEAKEFRPSLTRVAMELLEPIRNGLGKPIKVNSGFRGFTLNKIVGGSMTSQHCRGEAVDFDVEGYEDRAGMIAVIQWVLDSKIPFGQLLLERGCIHISLGEKRQVAEAWHDGVEWKKKPIHELAEQA